SPPGWANEEDALWRAFAKNAPPMLAFLESTTPLRFALTDEPDTMAEKPGGKRRGRMVSPLPLRRSLLGPLAQHLRPSTLPHLFTYHEVYGGDLYHRPIVGTLRHLPRLVWRLLTGARGQGSALVIGLVRGCLDLGCRIHLDNAVEDLVIENGQIAGVVLS